MRPARRDGLNASPAAASAEISASTIVLPAQVQPIKAATLQCAQNHHVCQPLIGRQRKGDVERHPVLHEIEAVDEIGVPAQFPAEATMSCCDAASAGATTSAAAAIPASPSRATSASI